MSRMKKSSDGSSHGKGKSVGRGVMSAGRLLRFSLLFIFLSSLGVYAVYSQVPTEKVAWDSSLFSFQFLLATLTLLGIYYFLDGLRLWFVLRTLQHTIPLAAMIRLVFINLFVSNVTPMATGGGVAQVWYLQRQGVPVGTAMTATTIRTVLAVLFIFSVGPVMLLKLTDAQTLSRYTSIFHALGVFAAAYIGFFVMVMLRTKSLIKVLISILKLLRRLHLLSAIRYVRWKEGIVREMIRFAGGFRTYLKGKWHYILASIFATAGFLLSLFSFPALITTALGYDLHYWLVIGRLLITTFVMYFSPTPGASGIAEGVFGYFFSDILTAGHLVLVTVLWRAITIYLGMGIGIFFMHREITHESK